MNNPRLSIVIPVFNSCEIVEKLFGSMRDALQSFVWELILVNDGSSDGSWDAISELATKNSNVVAIDLRFNSGQDNAIMAGIRESNGDFVVVMDDDLQHNPADIPTLYAKCTEGYDVVYAGFREWKQSPLRKTGSRFNSGFARWLLGKSSGLYLSPFKIITRKMADEVSRFVGPYPYVDGIILSLTSRIGQVVVSHHKRYSGQSNYTMKRSAGVWFRLFTGFSVAPLRIATLAGLIIALSGLGLMGYYLYEYFFTSHIVEGWTTIVLLLIFFGGLILMMLGLLGEYIGRIYLTLNGKPQYSIRAIVRKSEKN